MEKVKVTREQAEAIEKWVNKEQLIIAKASGLLEHSIDEPIAELTMKQLVVAIYIGYEVEQEFKVGDWVVNTSSGYIKLIENEREANFLNNDYIKYHELRHATPEEIAAEKERRWWAKHGRDVWELRPGDLLVSDTNFFEEVREVNNDSVTFVFENYVAMDRLKLYYKVVCFAENRLDGDFGEGD